MNKHSLSFFFRGTGLFVAIVILISSLMELINNHRMNSVDPEIQNNNNNIIIEDTKASKKSPKVDKQGK